MPLGIGLVQFIVAPPLLLLASVFALVNFQNVVRIALAYLAEASKLAASKMFRPYLTQLRLLLEQVLGKAASFKISFSHVLMMGVIIMLLAVYNAIQQNTQFQRQRVQIALARQQQQRKREEEY